MPWEAVVGLEIHAQLVTRTKLFSGAPAAVGAEPNQQACAIDLGYPGVLPVLNKDVLRMAVMFGVATNATIARRSIFARKNYFYPDLPKGYQISQYELPIIQNGEVQINRTNGSTKRIGITRAHLEEDAGKSIHSLFPQQTALDLNRAGVPLLEIVSAPDMRSADEATAYMRTIHSLVRYLQICDGNMQDGSFRCDANVSVRQSGDANLGTRTEIKNLNSFRFVGRAINYEIDRQIELLRRNKTITQETRLYDAAKNETRAMRGKEEANDYRYFPDPDLLPVNLTPDYVAHVANALPELPSQKLVRFRTQYQLEEQDARRLTARPELADYYETVAQQSKYPQSAANWITGNITEAMHRDALDITNCPIEPSHLAILIIRIHDGTLSTTMAKKVFEALWNCDDHPDTIIKTQGFAQVSNSGEIDTYVQQVITEYPDQAEDFRNGKEKLLAFFVGQIMKLTRGQANPVKVTESLKRHLRRSTH